MCELSPWSRGHYFGRSTVDSRPGQGGTLIGAWRAAATEGGSSSWEHLEKEGVEGNLTVGEGGQHGGGARPATMDQNGGGLELGVGRIESQRGKAESGTRCGGVLQCWGFLL
jgi:hypothetical protein